MWGQLQGMTLLANTTGTALVDCTVSGNIGERIVYVTSSGLTITVT